MQKTQATNKRDNMTAVAGGSLAGTAIEWYDFFLYGTAAALVFNKLFFPHSDETVGTLLAFSTYAVGFLARPVGAVVLGHFGDRRGRRATLIASLLLMGGATFGIALLPSYATVGVLAPVLLVLLRLVQGFALGGEWGGAVLLVSEHSDGRSRAFWSALPNLGPPLGNLMAAGVLALLGALLSESAFLGWGWRIPFALSAILVGVGLWLRLYVAETPLFQRAQERQQREAAHTPRPPVAEVVRGHWRQILLAAGTRFGENAGFYIFSLFVITYVTQLLHLPESTALSSVMIGQGVAILAIPAFAVLADRVGRRPILIGASVYMIGWSFAFFALLDTKSPTAVLIAVVGGLLAFAAYSSVIGAFFSELFPTEVRYSGVSIAYNVASVFAGSLAPLISLALYDKFGSGTAVAVYLAAMSAVSLGAAVVARETREVDLATLQRPADSAADVQPATTTVGQR